MCADGMAISESMLFFSLSISIGVSVELPRSVDAVEMDQAVWDCVNVAAHIHMKRIDITQCI